MEPFWLRFELPLDALFLLLPAALFFELPLFLLFAIANLLSEISSILFLEREILYSF
jgi:hypothetical protein